MSDPRTTFDPAEAQQAQTHETAAPRREDEYLRAAGYSNIYNPQAHSPEGRAPHGNAQPGWLPPGGYYGRYQPPRQAPYPADPYARPARDHRGAYGQPQGSDAYRSDTYRGEQYLDDAHRYDAHRCDAYRDDRQRGATGTYNNTTGWQDAPRPEPRYEWNQSDYEACDHARGGPKASKRGRGRGFILFSVCLIASISVGLAVILLSGILNEGGVAVNAPPQESSEAAGSAASQGDAGASVHLDLSSKPSMPASPLPDGKLSIPDVAEIVTPSVVSVIKYVNSQFMEAAGLGSGIIISEDGYIITNAHVVSGGTDFKVQLHNGDPYDAYVVGADTATDLAVLKIDASGLTPAQFGDSNELRVGKTVIAIGNPVNLNFAGSVTMGIVSALNRQVEYSHYSINYIQTDAAINPGNSGGALVNEFGQVIGINVAKIGGSGYEGMGFAIPMSDARPVIEDLLLYGRVTGRVKLGISGTAVDEYDAKRYGWQAGVMIQSIDEKSDLIGKNVQKGDIITHINGERIYVVSDIHAILDGCKVGDVVELTLSRKIGTTRSTEVTVQVTLMEDVE